MKLSAFQKSCFFLFLPCFLACSKKTNDSAATTTTPTDSVCASLTTPVTSSLAMTGLQNDFFDEAQTMVRDLVPEPIEANLKPASFIERGGARHVNFSFSLSGIPLCQMEARVHSLKDKTYVEGQFPDSSMIGEVPSLMKASPKDLERIFSQLKLKGTASHRTNKSCLAWDGTRFVSALEVNFQVNKLPYYALLTENELLRAEPRFFEGVVTETSQIYVKSPTASTNLVLQTITLPAMSSGGSLCSARMMISLPSGVQPAFATKKTFNFATTDIRFKETSFFTNATTHSNWFLSVGPLSPWPGPKIDLLMDNTNNFLNDTSVYIPETSTTPPTIRVGGGDGVNLQDLYIDYDVVSHELGHHIVYQTLTTIDGQSLVIHEGLADWFVYADTLNPCLGNLICPTGSTLCQTSQCLRIGTYPFTFASPNLPTEAHKLSQVLSSMLWDIGNGNTTLGITGIGMKVITPISLKAIDFFPSNAQYTDLIRSLMQADKALNASANCSTIYSAANARGLGGALQSANVNCSTVP